MNDKIIVTLILVIAFLLLWVLVWRPRRKAAHIERERLAADAKSRQEAERIKFQAERERLAAEKHSRLEAEKARFQAEQERLAGEERARQVAEQARQQLEMGERTAEERVPDEAERARQRAARERLAAERHPAFSGYYTSRDTERTSLQDERDDLLKSIRSGAPDFILQARQEFERDYRAGSDGGCFGQEMSPLVCFGYRVGKTNGRTETERRAILKYGLAADLDITLAFLPASYRKDWGGPLSVIRFNRILQHLHKMADLRDGRPNFDVAVSHWRSDASWFQTLRGEYVDKFRSISKSASTR